MASASPRRVPALCTASGGLRPSAGRPGSPSPSVHTTAGPSLLSAASVSGAPLPARPAGWHRTRGPPRVCLGRGHSPRQGLDWPWRAHLSSPGGKGALVALLRPGPCGRKSWARTALPCVLLSHLPSLWICGRWQSEAPGPADGLQPGVCPATSPLTLAVPTCLREGTMWTSHARPSVGWRGGWPWAKASVPRPPQQRRQQQRGVLGQASPTCGRRALAPEAHHQPVQVRAAPAAHEQAHHLHGRAAALVQRARHPVQGGLRHR